MLSTVGKEAASFQVDAGAPSLVGSRAAGPGLSALHWNGTPSPWLLLIQFSLPQQEVFMGLPRWRQWSKNPLASAGEIRDLSLIPGWGRSPGGGHSSPLQCSCLESPVDRGAWRAAVRGDAQSQTRLSDFDFLFSHSAVLLPGESHGQRSLAGCSPCGPRESDTAERSCKGHNTAL